MWGIMGERTPVGVFYSVKLGHTAVTFPVTVTPKSTELAAAAPGTPTVPSALPVIPLARSGSASGPPHTMSGRAAVFVNAHIVSRRSGRRLCALPARASTGGPRGGRRGRSRWRSAATASRRRSRSAPMGTPTVMGSRMSWHSAVLTPARWSPVTGVPRLELLRPIGSLRKGALPTAHGGWWGL